MCGHSSVLLSPLIMWCVKSASARSPGSARNAASTTRPVASVATRVIASTGRAVLMRRVAASLGVGKRALTRSCTSASEGRSSASLAHTPLRRADSLGPSGGARSRGT